MAQNLLNNDSYKCYSPRNNTGLDLAIYEAGYEKCDPLHCWGPYKKFGYVFHYVLDGKGKLIINNKEFAVNKHDVFFIAPDDECYYEADANEPWEYQWVFFGGVQAKNIINRTVFGKGQFIIHYANKEEILPYYQAIYQEQSNIISDTKAIAKLYDFLAFLLQNFANEELNSHSYSDNYLNQIINFIYMNVAKNITVNSISRSIGLNRTYIYKLFIKSIGISPMDYIKNLKIYLACQKIKENKLTLTQIAREVGFNDYSWFCILFKKIIGIRPNEYLEKNESIIPSPSFSIIQNKANDYFRYFNKS